MLHERPSTLELGVVAQPGLAFSAPQEKVRNAGAQPILTLEAASTIFELRYHFNMRSITLLSTRLHSLASRSRQDGDQLHQAAYG